MLRNCFILILMIISTNMQAQKVLSGGISLGLSGSQSLLNEKQKINITAAGNYKFHLMYVTENTFWAGLQYNYQWRNVLIDEVKYPSSREQLFFQFTESRLVLQTGFKTKADETKYMPYLGLGLSAFSNPTLTFNSVKKGDGLILGVGSGAAGAHLNGILDKRNFMMEFGLNYLAPDMQESKMSFLGNISIRYYPLSIVKDNSRFSYTNLKQETHLFNSPVKLIEIGFSMGIQYNKDLEK